MMPSSAHKAPIDGKCGVDGGQGGRNGSEGASLMMMLKRILTTSFKLCSTERLMCDARVCESLEGNPYWMMGMKRGVMLKWNAAQFTSCILQIKEKTNSSSRTPS